MLLASLTLFALQSGKFSIDGAVDVDLLLRDLFLVSACCGLILQAATKCPNAYFGILIYTFFGI